MVIDGPLAPDEDLFRLIGDEPAHVTFLRVVPPTQCRVSRLGPTLTVAVPLDGYDDADLMRARQAAWQLGVPADVVLMSGDLAECVGTCARERRPDAIVLQSSRRAAVASLVRGVPRAIRRAATCPVFLAA